MWAMLGKQLMKGGAKKVAKDKILNRKNKTNKRRASVKNIMGLEGKQKGGALTVSPNSGLVAAAKDLAPISTTPGESDIVIIKKQVIQVRDILKDTQTAKQAERVERKKAQQAQKREGREDKLEKKTVNPKAAKAKKIPTIGGGIGNFFSWLAFGIILNKLIDLLPSLKKIFNVIKPVAKFIIGVFEKTVGFVVGFIDFAYAGVEKLEKGVEAIGGEGAAKLFNKFGKLFTQVLNGALIAALVAATLGRNRRFRKPKGPKGNFRKGFERWFKRTPVGKLVRNQKANLLKRTRNFMRNTRLGRTFTALRPKNINKFIMEGGIDKTIKNVSSNLTERAKNIKLPKPKPDGGGFINWLGKKGSQAKKLAIKGKDLAVQGGQFAIKKGMEGIKFLADIPGKVLDAVKSIKWGEFPLVKQARGAFESISGNMSKWIDDIGKNLDPGKMINGLVDIAKPTIDTFLEKNVALKKLGGKIKPAEFVPWLAKNWEGFAKQAEPIANAVKGNKALKSMSNFLGPLDAVVDSLFALVDYAAGGENLVNAVVKALSSSLGFAAGAAAGAALTTTATFFTAGAGAPFVPFVTFGMGMAGSLLGEQIGNLILKGLAGIPALADMDDPIAEEMGLSPRKIIRDPFGDNKDDENINIQSSNGNTNVAEGLDITPSYGGDGVIEVKKETTYIQPIEV